MVLSADFEVVVIEVVGVVLGEASVEMVVGVGIGAVGEEAAKCVVGVVGGVG